MATIWGHLTLIGDNFDHSAVSAALSATPTWIKKPDDILGNGRRFGHCEWGVTTHKFIADDLSDVVDALMEALPCSSRQIAESAAPAKARWHILFSIDTDDDIPAMAIPPKFSAFAAEIGAEVGFDII